MTDVIMDSYSESNQDDYDSIRVVHPSAIGYNSARFQSFTPSVTKKLTSCKFSLMKVGSPVGNLKADLYAHSGTYGSTSVPTGNALATSSNSVAMASLSASAYALFTFTFDGTYTLTYGTNYCIVVYAADATTLDTTTNYILCGEDASSPGHGGNEGGYGSSTWYYSSPSVDMCFYVYATTYNLSVKSVSIQGIPFTVEAV
jgi:hypothetical protein